MSEVKGIKILDFTELQRIRYNDTGNRVIMDISYWDLDGDHFIKRVGQFSSALNKIIDEPLTNAADHLMDARNPRVEITYEDGTITVRNYGIYIPFESVTSCFTMQNCSSNYNDHETNVRGGTNGIGVKLTNILSRSFYVESCNGTECFTQLYEDGMRVKHPPEIRPSGGTEAYVMVRFRPEYDEICRVDKLTPSTNWLQDHGSLVHAIVRRRAYELAAFSSPIPFYFNGEPVRVTFDSFVAMHGGPNDKFIVDRMSTPQYPCRVGIIVHEPQPGKNDKKFISHGFDHVTMLNGLILDELSDYIPIIVGKIENYIRTHDQLQSIIRKPLEKNTLPKWMCMDHITIVTAMIYPANQYVPRGQVKSAVSFIKPAKADLIQNYHFSAYALKSIWQALVPCILKFVAPSNKVKSKIEQKLYIPATCLLGHAPRQADALLIVEGLSASTLMKYIISINPRLSAERCGIISTGGVPMNALKHSIQYPQGYQQDDRLQDNDALQGIAKALGLQYDRPGQTPRYRHVIICTDQDCDGIGKICSLLICFFMIYFPDLVKAGFVKRYRTPIVRVHQSNGQKILFYSEQAFEQYKLQHPNVVEHYYKGLGTHDDEDRMEMSASFFGDIINIRYDLAGEILMHHLYGPDTEIRKQELLLFDPAMMRTYCDDNNIIMYEHFNNESRMEQVNNIERMTPNVYDAMMSVHRKVLHVLRKKHRKLPSAGTQPKKTKLVKYTVSELAGIVKGKMKYDHGEAAMEEAINGMGQKFVGSNWFPLILSWSASNGSRNGGKKDVAKPRYTYVCENPFINFYYPLVDDSLLPVITQEGKQIEPSYYIGIVPRILLETTKNVATGWNSNLVGRDYDTVMRYVRLSIKMHPSIVCTNMLGRVQIIPTMRMIVHEGREICIGAYTILGTVLTVTELPLGVSAERYIKIIRQTRMDVLVTDPVNNSSDIINIKLYIKENVLEHIPKHCKKDYLDPLVEYFHIYKIFTCNLNFFKTQGPCLVDSRESNCSRPADRESKIGLKEYDCIYDVFVDWFEARRMLYIKRIEKCQTYYRLVVEMAENIYFALRTKVIERISNKKNAERDRILSEIEVTYTDGTVINGYRRFNQPMLNLQLPGDGPALEWAVRNGATYDYIDNIRFKQTTEHRIEKYRLQLQEHHANYRRSMEQSWRTTWLEELERLDHMYRFAVEKKWYWKDVLNYKC